MCYGNTCNVKKRNGQCMNTLHQAASLFVREGAHKTSRATSRSSPARVRVGGDGGEVVKCLISKFVLVRHVRDDHPLNHLGCRNEHLVVHDGSSLEVPVSDSLLHANRAGRHM